MKRKLIRNFLVAIAALSFLHCTVHVPASGMQASISNLNASVPAISLPANWTQVRSATGLVLGKRTYPRTSGSITDYVIIADFSQGARVRLRQGGPAMASPANPSPSFARQYLASTGKPQWYWNQYATTKTFAITSLAFGQLLASPTQIAFPLKENNQIITCGYGNNEPFNKRKIGINGTALVVADYTNTSNDYSTVAANLVSPTVIVGLHPDASKSPSSQIGRCFLAVKDQKLYAYISPKATQAQVKNVLTTEFGIDVTKIVMFDGSGSSQFTCKGTIYVPSSDSRTVNSALEFLEP